MDVNFLRWLSRYEAQPGRLRETEPSLYDLVTTAAAKEERMVALLKGTTSQTPESVEQFIEAIGRLQPMVDHVELRAVVGKLLGFRRDPADYASEFLIDEAPAVVERLRSDAEFVRISGGFDDLNEELAILNRLIRTELDDSAAIPEFESDGDGIAARRAKIADEIRSRLVETETKTQNIWWRTRVPVMVRRLLLGILALLAWALGESMPGGNLAVDIAIVFALFVAVDWLLIDVILEPRLSRSRHRTVLRIRDDVCGTYAKADRVLTAAMGTEQRT